MSNARQSYRWVGAGIFILLAIAVLFVIANTLAYFNSGASKKDIFHVDEAYFDSTRPYIRWTEDDGNVEGDINKYVREDIAKAYSQAIRALNLSFNLGEEVALKEHFTSNQRERILLGFRDNHFHLKEQVNLSHLLRLHFISLDKTVVSFTDVRSNVKQKIGNNYVDAIYSYHVNMTLVDGRWRIDALERTQPEENHSINGSAKFRKQLTGKRGINYYPAKTPWKAFWTEYDKKIIENDFLIMKKMKIRMVRFFIPFEIFGGADPSEDMLQKMDHFVRTARRSKIFVVPTLFDFPVGFTLDKYPIYDRHLEKIMSRYGNEKSILMWDLKNEPDLDFAQQGKEETLEWLKFIIQRARIYTDRPITIGWSKLKFAKILQEELDLVSFHYYEDINELEDRLLSLKNDCDKPIVISEYGQSTYRGIWQGGVTEKEQAAFFKQLHSIIDKHEVGGFAWCLYDYEVAPSNVFGRKPWVKAKQKHFGILKLDGSKKNRSSE